MSAGRELLLWTGVGEPPRAEGLVDVEKRGTPFRAWIGSDA